MDGRSVDRFNLAHVDRVARGRTALWQGGRRVGEVTISDPLEPTGALSARLATGRLLGPIRLSDARALEELIGELVLALGESRVAEPRERSRWSRLLIWLGSRA